MRKRNGLAIFCNYWVNMVENNSVDGISEMYLYRSKKKKKGRIKFLSGVMHVSHGIS